MAPRRRLSFAVKDAQSPVQRVEYSLDALRWRTIFPVDGIADAPDERYEILLEEGVTPADITIRAYDAMGNSVTASGNGPTAGVAAPRR